MKRLTDTQGSQVIAFVCEGNSLRAPVRLTGISKNTITKQLGDACIDYQGQTLRNLKCKRIQCTETWSFVYTWEKNVPAEKNGEFGYGADWTWTAIDNQD
ncbi:MAG: hypothetical protein P4N24_08485 [Acidobacteriota bacterium]|nr:hypothetical protein [Acidobacteriota bacterium]